MYPDSDCKIYWCCFAFYLLWSCNIHLLRSLNVLWTFYDSSISLAMMVNIDINSIQDTIQHFCFIYVYLLSLLWPIIPHLWCRFNRLWGMKSNKEWVLTRSLYLIIFMLANITHGVEEVWCLLDIRLVEGLSCVYVNHLPSQITVKVNPSKVEMQCLWCYWCAKFKSCCWQSSNISAAIS